MIVNPVIKQHLIKEVVDQVAHAMPYSLTHQTD